MNDKHPSAKVVVRIRKVPKTPAPNKPVKTVPCSIVITPDSLYRRDHPTNHELWLRLHAESIQRLLEGRKLTDHEPWLRTNFPKEEP